MSGFVADSSCVLAWILEDEQDGAGDALLESLVQGAVAESPVLLRYEVANVLVTAFTKRKRLSREGMLSGLADFESLPIRYDVESPRLATGKSAGLAEKHLLSVYDAAYLELAIRKGLPLATRDGGLIKAAEAEGVAIL